MDGVIRHFPNKEDFLNEACFGAKNFTVTIV